jgi:hypothetical protein
MIGIDWLEKKIGSLLEGDCSCIHECSRSRAGCACGLFPACLVMSSEAQVLL